MSKRTSLTGSAEDRLIARYFRPLAKHPGAFRLIDDCAVLTPPKGSDLVLKTDAIVGDVHFFSGDPPDKVAQKALRVNLSDLAAKGAKPQGFLLALALPAGIQEKWLAAFTRGLRKDADAFGCPLLGGDTVRTPGPVTISIAVFGTLPRKSMVTRWGARVGDRIMVTGTLGDAALGLLLRQDADAAARWELSRAQAAHLADRYLVPQPRNVLAEAVRRYASAGMDVSDGLVGDLGKLCKASGVGADVQAARVPLSPAARKAIAADPRLMETVLTGGDDYEIITTMAPKDVDLFRATAVTAGVMVTDIGAVTAGDGRVTAADVRVTAGDGRVHVRGPDGKRMLFKRASFSHF
jgi:thiamine-monophosphate kinase